MNTFLIKSLVACALSVAMSQAYAGAESAASDRIKERVTPHLRGLVVEKVMPSAHAGLYEVLTPAGLFYTDKNGSFVIFGATIVDTVTKENLTEKRLAEFSKFMFKELPLRDAIKTVRGDGSRVMVTFEDPNCGYCRKLAQEIEKLNNVTVYTFLIPILSPDSAVKSRAIWCSPDPARAWRDFIAGPVPTRELAAGSCETPIERNLALSRKLRINGTPALLFTSNTKVGGYITAEAIEQKLSK
jgi:thiol:disulfide interchange protein DsbC